MPPLVVSLLARPPHPARDGGGIRNYHLLRALGSAYRVRALFLMPPGADELPWEFPASVDASPFPIAPSMARTLGTVSRAIVGEPYTVAKYRSSELDETIRRELDRERPAWVVAHGFHMAPAALRSTGRAWVDLHNIESRIWSRTSETTSSLPLRAATRWQRGSVERLERRILAGATGVSVVSEEDARLAAVLSPGRTPVVVPNGVDLERYALRTDTPADPVLLFVGDLRWRPNADGVAWFRQAVWPRLRERSPQVRVEILGRGAGDELRALADDRFVFIGDAPDTRPSWRGATLGIVPLLSGGGTRLKILEAAAMGVPVVATSVGAEGLALSPGLEIVIADDPEGWVDSIASVLAQPDRGRGIGIAARSRVEGAYGWDRIAARFLDELAIRDADRMS